MNKNLKLFTSDQDRLAFEDSNSYERPYVSAVSGDAHFNKLITGTIENPTIGEVNVQDGDYFDRISVQKKIYTGNNNNNGYVNILCFPFDITVNELREALNGHKLTFICFGSNVNISAIQVNSQGLINSVKISLQSTLYDGTTIISAGTPIVICVDFRNSSPSSSIFTLTFKNKTININNSLISSQTTNSNCYLVGSPFRSTVDATGLSTGTNVLFCSSGAIVKSVSMSSNVATCSGWIEYRGPVPSE